MTVTQSYLVGHAFATLAVFAFGFLFKHHLKYGSYIHWWTTAGFAVGGVVLPFVPHEYLPNGGNGYGHIGLFIGWLFAAVHVGWRSRANPQARSESADSGKSEPEA